MKRKITVFLTTVICLILALCSFSACGFFASAPDGNTPFDVAVDNGYQGSLDNWLADGEGGTTQQKNWYESYLQAVQAGEFTGTFPEFLAAVGDGTAAANKALCSVVSVYAVGTSSHSAGAGVIYSLDKQTGSAYIVTNYHVVYRAALGKVDDHIVVYLYGNETYPNFDPDTSGAIDAYYVGGSMTSDIAVLHVEQSDALKGDSSIARAAVAANSDAVTVGESVFAVGNPLGKGLSVTRGVVSVEREEINATAADGITHMILPEIRTDAAVNHGNSGGGLFNLRGELVGIVNARLDSIKDGAGTEDGVAGFGYALPTNFALAVAESIIDGISYRTDGTIDYEKPAAATRAITGVECAVLSTQTVFNEETCKFYRQEKIVVNRTLLTGSACVTAGLRNGDTLISGKIIHAQREERTVMFTRLHKLDDFLYNVRKNDTVVLTVSRGGETKEISVVFSSPQDFVAVA